MSNSVELQPHSLAHPESVFLKQNLTGRLQWNSEDGLSSRFWDFLQRSVVIAIVYPFCHDSYCCGSHWKRGFLLTLRQVLHSGVKSSAPTDPFVPPALSHDGPQLSPHHRGGQGSRT